MPTQNPPLPPDDLQRDLALARPNEDLNLPHISIAGDTYTILLTGQNTAGRYCLIDRLVPPGGGPPRHRHERLQCIHAGWHTRGREAAGLSKSTRFESRKAFVEAPIDVVIPA